MMDLKKYGLDDEDISYLIDSVDNKILEGIDIKQIDSVVEVLKKYQIDFISDLLLADIGIFFYNSKDVELKIMKMIKELGVNYLDIINDDISIVVDAIYKPL